MGPVLGAKLRAARARNDKVRTSWTWTHWLVDSLGGLDKVVILNLDETGVPMFMGDLRGNIIFEPRVGRGHVLPTQNVPRNPTRAAVTHVGLICNRPDVQPYLPQLLLGDSSTLTVQAQREVQAAAPPNVTVWRLKSRWVDVAVMKTLLRAIGANLRANSPGLRPILIWDCCPAHLKDEVLQAARSCGIYIVLVPAKLTWLVQPLDACVFQRYKAVLRESYARIRQGTQHGIVTPAVWWRCLVEHVHVFMQSRDWSRAFEATGWIGHGVRASTFLKNSCSGIPFLRWRPNSRKCRPCKPCFPVAERQLLPRSDVPLRKQLHARRWL